MQFLPDTLGLPELLATLRAHSALVTLTKRANDSVPLFLCCWAEGLRGKPNKWVAIAGRQ